MDWFPSAICVLVMTMGFCGHWQDAQTLLLFCIFGQLFMIKEKMK